MAEAEAELYANAQEKEKQQDPIAPEKSKYSKVPTDKKHNKDDGIENSLIQLSKEVKELKLNQSQPTPTPSKSNNEKNNDPTWSIFHTKSSLLPYHPIIEESLNQERNISDNKNSMINTMNSTIEPYFQAYMDDNIPNSITKFWSDSHTLSCLRQQSFTCTPNQVCNDFYTIEDGSTSLCVNEALANGAIMIEIGKENKDLEDKNLILISSQQDNNDGFLKISNNEDKHTKIWNQSANCIGKQLKKQCFVVPATANVKSSQSNTQETEKPNDKVAISSSTSYISSAVYGVTGVAKYMTSNLSKGATYVLAKYDLADDPDEFGDIIYEENDYDEDDGGLQKQQATKLHFQLLNKDIVLNIPLVLKCCKCLLEYADEIITTASDTIDDNQPCGIRHQNKLLLQYQTNAGSNNRSIHSFRTFCQLAGKHQLNKNIASSKENKLIGTFMEQISTSNVDFLMNVLLSSSMCQMKDNVIGIFPNTITSSTESQQEQNMTEIDVAIFQLTQTKSSLENRITKLQLFEKQMAQKALQAKQTNNTKLALLYMKRRKHALSEIDHVATMLLNIEQGEEIIHRSINDRDVAVAYQTCTSALKQIRTSNDISLEDIDETVGDLKEELDLVKDMTEAMTLNTMDAVEEEEIMHEFEQMEREAMQDELNNLFPVVPGGVPIS